MGRIYLAPRTPFFARDLACGTVAQVLREIRERAESGRGGLVGYLNAHTTNLLHTDPRFDRATTGFDLIYPDGKGVVWAARRMGAPAGIERVNAGDFLVRFCWMARARGLRVALIGSGPGVAGRAAESLGAKVPGFQPVLVHHGHFERGSAEEARLLEDLARAKAHIVLVGMGSPRQEAWAAEHSRAFPTAVIWCVGALFEYFADRPRAPWWMREAGLEWLFRLVLEPRRLAGRYLVGNLRFVARVLAASGPVGK